MKAATKTHTHYTPGNLDPQGMTTSHLIEILSWYLFLYDK